MRHYKGFVYTPEPKTAWDNLSMNEKAAMIKVAVSNGITNLQEIKDKYNEFAEGGDTNEERPAIVPFKQKLEVIITPDSEYNQYLNTLPDNQRFTPNDEYDSYLYWKLHGKPRNFEEAYNRDMFHYDHSDNAYHANSIAWGDDGVGYFMKPKTHDTVGYELDWFNKGLVTEEGGHQRPETPEEKLEADKFRKNYILIDDPVRTNFYRYQPVEKAEGGHIYDGKTESTQKMITTGGAGFIPTIPTEEFTDKILSTISKKVMNYIKGAHDTGTYFSYDSDMEPYTGPAQDTYLLPKRIQEKEFLKRGYIKGEEKDYGLVKKAVGNRNLPVYQRNPDTTSRNNLTVLGNIHGWDPWYGDSSTGLEHAGSYPTAVYIDDKGNFYQKGWDLNDYGGKTGSTIGIISDIIDRIGSPTVVTTGYQPIKNPQNEKFIKDITPMMGLKGLVPTEVNGKTIWTIPEVTIYGNKHKDGGNIHIKDSKKGTFTAAATKHGMGVQEFASKVLSNKDDYSPTMVRKANFARNSKHWKHGLGRNLFGGEENHSQQMQLGPRYWADQTIYHDWQNSTIDGGTLPEVIVSPTNDASWLFSTGRYVHNPRKPLADKHTRKVVSGYLSKFDDESAKDYNERISRLANVLDIRGVQFKKNDVKSGKLKGRAHYIDNSGTAYIDDMNDIFAEVAHPWQYAKGNNNIEEEVGVGTYDSDNDPRGGTRYAYPDTAEGETHGFFEPALTEWVESGKISRSLPILNKELSKQKIIPKNRMEVADSAASWNRQAIDRRVISMPSQLPLWKRIKYNFADFPLLKKHGEGGNLFDGTSEDTQQMQIGREYWKSQANQPTFMEGLTKFNRQQELKKEQQSRALRQQISSAGKGLFDEAVKSSQTEANDNLWIDTPLTYKKAKNPHLAHRAEGAKAHAAWEEEHPVLNTVGMSLGIAPLAVATYPFLTGAGEAVAPILANPYIDAVATSAFTGHGLNHAINEGIDGLDDAAMTTLEVAPLGRVVKPALKEAAAIVENYRYPLGRPQIPNGYLTIKPQIKSYDNSITEVPFFTWGNDSRFKVSPTKESYKGLYSQLSAAKKYKESPEYADLVRKAAQESEKLGIGDFPEDLFISQNGKSIKLIFENRPKGELGEYVPEDNVMKLDMLQSEGMEVPYHEGIHWQKVGNPDNIGPNFSKWWEARKSGQSDDVQRKLFENFRNSEEYTRYIKRRNADRYLEYKVDNALYPFADDYLRARGELQAHGLEAGRAIGLKPFLPYPGLKGALDAISKARTYNPYLNNVKSGGEENVKRFWDILTGQYAPSLILSGLAGTEYGLTN